MKLSKMKLLLVVAILGASSMACAIAETINGGLGGIVVEESGMEDELGPPDPVILSEEDSAENDVGDTDARSSWTSGGCAAIHQPPQHRKW